mmetsp:Transcript_20930/g.35480  ORF Transcript_20930/g.35480 Transcript_20930/m.35480 type:complete len:94 (-) Transcript_20930:2-283(-)
MFCRVTLPFSRWPLSYYSIAGRWVVCATTSLPALAQLGSKHVIFPRGGTNKMRCNGIHMRIVEKMARGEKNAWNGKMSDWDYDKGQGERLGLR